MIVQKVWKTYLHSNNREKLYAENIGLQPLWNIVWEDVRTRWRWYGMAMA